MILLSARGRGRIRGWVCECVQTAYECVQCVHVHRKCVQTVYQHMHIRKKMLSYSLDREIKENWPRGHASYSFLKTNCNLLGRRLGHGRMQMKWYIIQGKMLPRVTILVTQIKTESSWKWKGVNFSLLEQQCIATLRHVVTPILDGVPEPSKWWQLSANPPSTKRCWPDIGPQGPNLGYVLNTPRAWHLPWTCLNARGGGKKHHRDQEQKRVSDFSCTSRPALCSS